MALLLPCATDPRMSNWAMQRGRFCDGWHPTAGLQWPWSAVEDALMYGSESAYGASGISASTAGKTTKACPSSVIPSGHCFPRGFG
jgi:hypothetical protein